MSSGYLSPNEKVILDAHGSVEKPIRGHGHLYLTDRRLLLVHRSGFVKIKETPVLDISISQISYSKIEGMLRRTLVLGVKAGNGQVLPYTIRVQGEEKWFSQIYTLKGESKGSVPPGFPESKKETDSKYCGDCGREVRDSKFCSNCGKNQNETS